MDRRDMLKALGLGTAVGALGIARNENDAAALTDRLLPMRPARRPRM